MPPNLALGLTVLLIVILLTRESRLYASVSGAVWIPWLWLCILGSRAVSQWLDPSSMSQTGDAFTDGSPIDRFFYTTVIVCAILVLRRRNANWRVLLAQNPMYIVFLLYCALSILWADYPLVSFRKWIKGLGDPLMILILLTEKNPSASIVTVLRRCAFVLIPLSIIFIKYFPNIGRTYSDWGPGYNTGVTTNKNLLGYLLFVFGLLFVSSLLTKADNATPKWERRVEFGVAVAYLAMIQWLFNVADTKTPYIALLVACLVVVSLALQIIRRHFGTVLVFCVTVGVLLQSLFDVQSSLIQSAGRDSTLTGRTELWQSVLSMAVNPWIGAGYESFWIGERRLALWAVYNFRPTQAHNGYIETYLNLGIVGVVVLVLLLFTCYRTARPRLARAVEHGLLRDELLLVKFQLGYLPAYLLYNYTEGTFQSLNFLFVIFLLLTLRAPQHQQLASAPSGVARPTRGSIEAWRHHYPSGHLRPARRTWVRPVD